MGNIERGELQKGRETNPTTINVDFNRVPVKTFPFECRKDEEIIG